MALSIYIVSYQIILMYTGCGVTICGGTLAGQIESDYVARGHACPCSNWLQEIWGAAKSVWVSSWATKVEPFFIKSCSLRLCNKVFLENLIFSPISERRLF